MTTPNPQEETPMSNPTIEELYPQAPRPWHEWRDVDAIAETDPDPARTASERDAAGLWP
jgi:hypothetical protein